MNVELFAVDFEKFQYDLGHARKLGVDDPLIRAIGKVRTVVDATAGLGRDAAALALAGYDVTACERAPAIAAMWMRARLPKRLTFVAGDTRVVIATLPAPEAIYIDPMYPGHDDRTAAPAKELLDLRAIVGDDDDAADLLAIARRTALLRVVVKRPKKAAPLAPDVDNAWKGASTRYDLYLRS